MTTIGRTERVLFEKVNWSITRRKASKEGTRAGGVVVMPRRPRLTAVCLRVQMKRRVLSMNYTDNYANDRIVRIIGIVKIICGAAALMAGSTSAMAESGMASVYAYRL